MVNMLSEVVKADFRSYDGMVVEGAYATSEDGWVLVQSDLFECLLYSGMAFEFAEKAYGKRIIQRYNGSQPQEYIATGDQRLDILALIIKGYTKEEAAKAQKVSIRSVDTALAFAQSLNAGQLCALFFSHGGDAFAGVSGDDLRDFVTCACSYPRYRRVLDEKVEAALKAED